MNHQGLNKEICMDNKIIISRRKFLMISCATTYSLTVAPLSHALGPFLLGWAVRQFLVKGGQKLVQHSVKSLGGSRKVAAGTASAAALAADFGIAYADEKSSSANANYIPKNEKDIYEEYVRNELEPTDKLLYWQKGGSGLISFTFFNPDPTNVADYLRIALVDEETNKVEMEKGYHLTIEPHSAASFNFEFTGIKNSGMKRLFITTANKSMKSNRIVVI